jgi:hypothetical protein
MEHPNNSRGDVTYWQLKPAQAARYHSRLSTMHARQSRRFADRAIAEARKAEIGCWASGGILALTLLIKLGQAVTG